MKMIEIYWRNMYVSVPYSRITNYDILQHNMVLSLIFSDK